MTLDQIRYFLEVCNTLHYTKAAHNLNISQPSLSYAIKQLEEELEVPLFRKEKKTVYITDYGKMFQPYCQRALDSLQQGEFYIREMVNPNLGNINLGYVYSTGSQLVPNLIEAYHDYKGDNKVTFILKMANSPSILDSIKDELLDFGILPLLNNNIDGIGTMPVHRQELYLIASKQHRLANNKFVEIEDLADEKIVALDKESDLYERTKMLFREKDLVPNFYYDVDELNSMAAFVSANMGIGITPNTPVLKSYDLVVIPFENHSIKRNVYMIWNSKISHTPVVLDFLEFARSHINH
ncbi:MAG: LysR family transcriptional regulator [Tissierellia bacterium]|nr:LysR family transcriptional regulator [Tissierellia bacterium]